MSLYDKYTDGELVTLLHSSDEAAFKIIYERFYANICYFAQYFITNKEDAKDIAAESFLKLWNLRTNFDSLSKIQNFLEVNTRNACFNFLKHQKVVAQHQKRLLQSNESENITDANLRIHLLEAEILRRIYAEIEHLHPQCKSIFKLAYLEGLKSNEIAERLNISIQTVYNQKNIALKALRTAIKNEKVDLVPLLLLLYSSSI